MVARHDFPRFSDEGLEFCLVPRNRINAQVNGWDIIADVDDPEMPLLYFLRNKLGLRGPRFGCGLGQCGACMVDIDGVAVRSCIYPIASVHGKVCSGTHLKIVRAVLHAANG